MLNFCGIVVAILKMATGRRYAGRKSKMAATAGHRLTLDPMGKYSNAFY